MIFKWKNIIIFEMVFYQFLWVWQLLPLDMENFNVTNNNIENVL